MKVADLYIRVSTEEQADKGYSQRDQEERLKKYCEINSIAVRKVIYEDYSAKTFNRPEWKKLLVDLKKNRGQSDLILFIKWDRFSRNAGDAYQMIGILRRLGVEPQAVEQPLDLSIPENKMMLAFYLAAPEVENDRRALNTLHGMRRAKKEGRWMGGAPIGYCNTVIDGKKAIAPLAPKSEIMTWAFETIAAGSVNVEQVWKEVNNKGLICRKSPFWRAIRNPVYCGIIQIPKYQNEEAHEVPGTHEPLISRELFYQVQDVLGGKKRFQNLKLEGESLFPLRGVLACPKCDRNLTASISKGKTRRYAYYHCNSKCGFRHAAGLVNDEFLSLLKEYELPPVGLTLVDTIFQQIFNSKTANFSAELSEARKTIKEEQERIEKARELLINGDFDGGDFRTVKIKSENNIERLNTKIESLSIDVIAYNPEVINKMNSIADTYENAPLDKKRKIISSMFPEKIVFTGDTYRTPKVNAVSSIMHMINSALRKNKKGTKLDFKAMYLEVTLKVQNSNSFIHDYKLIELLVA